METETVELIGDLERAFAGAIYPNRILISIVGVGLLGALVLIARRRRWHRAFGRHPRRSAIGALVVLMVAAPLGWYLGSPLFISRTIDEPPPVTAADPTTEPAPAAATDHPGPSRAPASDEPTHSSTAAPLIERSGKFRGADDFHFGQGTAHLIETSPGAFAVRLEDFAVRNGPDLHVYISPVADGDVDRAIELGRLKADRGNQNYEVPAGADMRGAAAVVIWCKQFSVLFATATLE